MANMGNTVQAVAAETLPGVKEFAQQLLDWARSGADIAKEQVPALAQEIVRWGVASEAFHTALAVLTLLGALVLVRRVWLHASAWVETDTFPSVAAFALHICGVVVCTVSGLVSLFQHAPVLLMAMYAPRLYIIQYLAALVK